MKSIIRFLALAAALVWAGSAMAQQYPTKPVKIIVPFPAGGITDVAARLIALHLSERLKQQFYIENIAGAGGNLGMGNVARAAGDGYTILFASSSIVVNPSLYTKVPYNIDKDLVPITKAGASPNAWMVKADFPAKTMKEMIDVIRREPGKHSVASPGTGTTPSLSIEMLKTRLGLNFVTVPFAGGGPMMQSLLGGHTPIVCGAIGSWVPLITQGKVRALAITSKERLVSTPGIPTLEESGIKDQEAETMTGVFAPAKTPKAVVELLQREIAAIVRKPEVKERLLALGIVPVGDSSADFTVYIKAEVAKWRKVIEDAKIKKI